MDEVAGELERISVVYDTYNFSQGEPFGPEIARRMSEAGVFVLLASPDALRSRFVKLEIDEAKSLRQSGIIETALVFLYRGATYKELPGWLRDGRVIDAHNPIQVANAIRERLVQIIERDQNVTFIDRYDEQDEAQRIFFPADASRRRKAILFYGRPGSGRRALATKIAHERLRTEKTYLVNIESGDSLSDMVIKLAQFAETYDSRADLRYAITEIEEADPNRINEKLEEYIATFIAQNTTPIYVDGGGIIGVDGEIHEEFLSLLRTCIRTPNSFPLIVAKQRPRASQLISNMLGMIKVAPLEPDFAKQLAAEEAARSHVATTETKLEQLVKYIGGHPPSIRYAVELAADRGIDAVLADKRDIAQYRIDFFSEDLRNDAHLTERQKHVLVTLDYYSPLPLNVLSDIIGISRRETAETIQYLLDCVFIQVDREGRYHLSSPLADVVDNVFDAWQPVHDRVLVALERALPEHGRIENRLALERARFRALTMSSRPTRAADVVALAADFVRAARDAYRAERYSQALEIATTAVERRPSDFEANRIYIQSLVKMRRFQDARDHVDSIRETIPPHEYHFFNGFISRGEGNFPEAIAAYEKAISLRRGGLSIHRELALCYFRVGNLPEADKHILEARRNRRDNPFVIDLQIQIAIAQGRETDSRRLLEVAKRIDRSDHPILSEATISIAFGDPESAIVTLDTLRSTGKRWEPFPQLRLRIIAYISWKRYSEANKLLLAMRTRFGESYEHDVVVLTAGLLASSVDPRDAILEIERYSSYVETGQILTILRGVKDRISDAERRQIIQILLNRGVYDAIDRDIANDDGDNS